jgi:hypothetical protein
MLDSLPEIGLKLRKLGKLLHILYIHTVLVCSAQLESPHPVPVPPPGTQLQRFLTVLEYSPSGVKFPPTAN